MDVRLAQACGGDANEARLVLKLADVAATRVAHAGAQAADELRDHLGERPLVRHAPFDAFGHELRFDLNFFLTVTITRTLTHRAD